MWKSVPDELSLTPYIYITDETWFCSTFFWNFYIFLVQKKKDGFLKTNKISKEDFECMILNHFIMRRIGYDTMTAFKIALNVKLNSIMPMYNKMFEMLDGWDLFNDGEEVTRVVDDEGENSINSTVNTSNTSDRRYSDAPQNRLLDVQSGEYVSDYNYDTDSGESTTESTGNDSRTTNETITRTPSDKIKIYKGLETSKTDFLRWWGKGATLLVAGIATPREKD